MKFSNSTRTSFFTILLITILTMGIGGYSAFHTRTAEVREINTSLDFVAQAALENPRQSVGAALFAIEQLTLNITLTLLTPEGQETIVNESSLNYQGAPPIARVQEATRHPIRISADSPYQLRSIRTPGGEFILVARSVAEVDEHFNSNIASLAVFTVIADSFTALLLLVYFRRVNRRDQVDSLSRMQEFLGDASHELRTPLTVIKGYVEMLSKKQLVAESDQERAFDRVGSEINRMENLIQDLLLLAELGESGRRDIEKVDVSDILLAHGTDFTTLHPQRKVILEIEPGIEIAASRDYLSRFIQNALTNIMRHTKPDDSVKITCKRASKYVHIAIEDSGPGLPDGAYREDVRSLNRFDKSRSRENGGSGLGMSIMSAVVQKLNGRFSLRKSELGGLAIVVDLPLPKD